MQGEEKPKALAEERVSEEELSLTELQQSVLAKLAFTSFQLLFHLVCKTETLLQEKWGEFYLPSMDQLERKSFSFTSFCLLISFEVQRT